ncbi:MAG: CotH kinase family protein [Candidatus Electrothrix communis]|nr:MAG: CotH kinase family protein [Candidatus Electrothrix communis]
MRIFSKNRCLRTLSFLIFFLLYALQLSVWASKGEDLWKLTEEKIFNGQVHKIYIKMNQASWNQLHDDEKQHGCQKSDDVKWVHARSFVFDDIVFKNSALKVRGNSSRCIPRLQFKVDLTRIKKVSSRQGNEPWHEVHYDRATKKAIKKRDLFGLESLNLRRSFNDSTSENDSGNGMLARERVAAWSTAQVEQIHSTTLRGAPVYRTAYALVEFQLCADDQDKSCSHRFRRVYLVTESINKDFFRMRYDDKKPTFFAMSQACALMDNTGFNFYCLEPKYIEGKKFDEKDSRQRVTAQNYLTGPNGLRTRLKNADTPEKLAQVLDLNNIMNYAAVATTIGHWDSAYGNFNNDVLYFHQPSGKWKLITWDLDNTFDYDNKGGPDRSYDYTDVVSSQRPLFDKLFSFPTTNERTRQRMRDYLSLLYQGDDKGSGLLRDRIVSARDQEICPLNASVVPGERQNLQRAQEMLDYTRDRYQNLKGELSEQ